MEVLIAEHRFSGERFEPSPRGDTCPMPHRMRLPRKGSSRQQIQVLDEPHLIMLPGTMLIWWQSNYEYGEWDCDPAAEHLEEIITLECTNWEKMALADTTTENEREP